MTITSNRIPRRLAAFGIAFLATTASGALTAARADEHQILRGRLVYADHEKPLVRILDLDTFETTHSFAVGRANSSLFGLEGGRHVAVRTNDEAGTIRFLDTGLRRESHDDHIDIDKGTPRLLDLTITGDKPSHVVSENGWVALFYDGDRPWERKSEPKVVAIKGVSLDDPNPVATTWKSPAPQHGIAVPLGRDEWLVSVSKEAYAKGDDRSVTSRPNGFAILNRKKNWSPIASFNEPTRPDRSCKEFHGHASLKNVHLFGCNAKLGDDPKSDGGVLILQRSAKGAWEGRKLAYPDGRRTSTIKAAGGQFAVGNYGPLGGAPFDSLLRVDPRASTLSAADIFKLPEGQAVCQFEVAAGGKRVANLTADGKLRIYETSPNWREIKTFDAVPAFDCAYGAKTPTPAIAVIGQSVFVSDPLNRRIREFHLETLQQGLDAPVEGMPANLAGMGSGG